MYIRGGKQRGERPYLTLMLHATAVHPRLTFDRPEVILPAVPLGHTARASFYVVNEGYDNLQIQHRLPVDTARLYLSITLTLTLALPLTLILTLTLPLPLPLALALPLPLALTK